MQSDNNSTLHSRDCRPTSIFRLFISTILTAACWVSTASANDLHPLTDIVSSAENFLRDTGGRQFGDSLSVEIQSPDPRLRLARCNTPLEVFSAPGARAFGNTSIGVRCTGAAPWTLYLRARVRVWQDVLVARGALSRGDTVADSDVMLQKMDISQVNGRFMHKASQAVNLELRRSVSPGVILTSNMLQSPQIIKRGDRVTLVAKAGNLSVRVAGKALAGGAKGDQIAVENSASKRRVQGVIMASGVIRTDHGALTANLPLGNNELTVSNTKVLPSQADHLGVF